MNEQIDVLMVTYDRAAYTRASLSRLLETCNDHMNVWIWHNGDDAETLAVVRELAQHPRVAEFHHSPENLRLWTPTRWFWEGSQAAYLSKVDDDCLLPDGWATQLVQAHESVPEFGILGCWRFPEEDFVESVARRKIQQFGEHQLLRNFWVEGSGYLMKRACLEQVGTLRPGESFTQWCIRTARAGWVNGWLYPFILQEHMDDPRAPHTGLTSDEAFRRNRPLTAINNGVDDLVGWTALLKEDALRVQRAPIHAGYWAPWRVKLRRLRRKLTTQRHLGGVL